MSKPRRHPPRQPYSDEDSEVIPLTSTPSASSAPPAFNLQTIQKDGKKIIRRFPSSPSETDSNEQERDPDEQSSASSPERARDIPSSRNTQQIRAQNQTRSRRASKVPQDSTKKPKKKKKKGYYDNVDKEIIRLQRSTALQIPRVSFSRVVREVLQLIDDRCDFQWNREALEALHEASEYILVRMFEVSYLLALHAGRITLMKKDIQLARRICADIQF